MVAKFIADYAQLRRCDYRQKKQITGQLVEVAMSFISPALIARIYQALGQNRGYDAVMLLRQHSFGCQPLDDGDLIAEVLRIADGEMSCSNSDRAEEHYQLGLALYKSCFPHRHADALRCAAALIVIAEKAGDPRKVCEAIQEAEAITLALRDEYRKPKVVAV